MKLHKPSYIVMDGTEVLSAAGKSKRLNLYEKFEAIRGLNESNVIKDLERHRGYIIDVLTASKAETRSLSWVDDLSRETQELITHSSERAAGAKSLSELGFAHEVDMFQSMLKGPVDEAVFKDVVNFASRKNPITAFQKTIKDYEELVLGFVREPKMGTELYATEAWRDIFNKSTKERNKINLKYLQEQNNHPSEAFKNAVDDASDLMK